jgi:hypothetical protein
MGRRFSGRWLACLLGVGALSLTGVPSATVAAPLQLAMLTPAAAQPGGAGFGVRWGAERSALAVNPLVAAPGQVVTLQVENPAGGRFALDAGAGAVQRLGPAHWRWTAPGRPGAYTLEVARGDGARGFIKLVAPGSARALRGRKKLLFLWVADTFLQRFDLLIGLGAHRRDCIQMLADRVIMDGSQWIVRRVLEGQQHLQTVLHRVGDRSLCQQGPSHGLLVHFLEAVARSHQPP